jgi:hypothetical protein
VLSNISHQKAVDYLFQHFDEIPSMDPMMQSAVIELIQKDAALNLVNKVSLPLYCLEIDGIGKIFAFEFRFVGIEFQYRCL